MEGVQKEKDEKTLPGKNGDLRCAGVDSLEHI